MMRFVRCRGNLAPGGCLEKLCTCVVWFRALEFDAPRLDFEFHGKEVLVVSLETAGRQGKMDAQLQNLDVG